MPNARDIESMRPQQSEQPLVTFALFAYNQEQYIHEAVQGALTQTYQPLEIILSDDCSTDKTFSIMQELVEQYRGPHSVRVNRTASNIGAFRHVLQVVALSRRKYVVMAAGDDVSLPERVTVCTDALVRTRAAAMCSGWHVISEDGSFIDRDISPNSLKLTLDAIMTRDDGLGPKSIQGATSCYESSFLRLAHYPEFRVDGEDDIFSFAANLRGDNVIYLSDPLVLYRRHDKAEYNNSHYSKKWSPEIETLSKRRLTLNLNVKRYELELFDRLSAVESPKARVDVGRLRRGVRAMESMYYWDQTTVMSRLLSATLTLFNLRQRREAPYLLKWKVARVFGRTPDYQPLALLKGSGWL